jgi:hypothetical protein
MYKKIFGGIAVLAIAAVAVFNVNLTSQKSDLSSVSLANVEALAQGEGSTTSYYKKFCSNYNNYYKCTTTKQQETCLGPNPPYPC